MFITLPQAQRLNYPWEGPIIMTNYLWLEGTYKGICPFKKPLKNQPQDCKTDPVGQQ